MIKVSFTGDILISPEQLDAVYQSQGKYDFEVIFEHIHERLKKSDFLIGNLETPLAGKKLKYTHYKWSFNTPDTLALALKNAGFNLLTTANNHCLDRGIEGLKHTIEVLDHYNIGHTGTYKNTQERSNGYITKIKNVEIAFLSYTYGTNAAFNKHYVSESIVNLFQPQEKPLNQSLFCRACRRLLNIVHIYHLYESIVQDIFSIKYKRQIERDIQSVKQKGANIIIMCMHAGGQYNSFPDINTRNLMRFLLKSPIDTVIGNHPHVIHPSIKLNGKIGFYSLGDLCPYPGCASAELAIPAVHPEYSILVHVYIDECKGKIQKYTFEILKSVIDKNDCIAKIHSLFDLIYSTRDEQEKRKLEENNLAIYNLVTNSRKFSVALQREYEL